MDAAPDLPPVLSLIQRVLGLEASQLSVLLHLVCVLMEKLEPVLKALGIHDVMGGLIDRFLVTPLIGLSARDSSHNN